MKRKVPTYLAEPSAAPVQPGSPAPIPDPDSAAHDILKFLSNKDNIPGGRLRWIAKSIQRPESTCHHAVRKLMHLGFIERIPMTYRLTDAAREYLAENGGWPAEIIKLQWGEAQRIPKIGHKIQFPEDKANDSI